MFLIFGPDYLFLNSLDSALVALRHLSRLVSRYDNFTVANLTLLTLIYKEIK